jgi:hypothetical protein
MSPSTALYTAATEPIDSELRTAHYIHAITHLCNVGHLSPVKTKTTSFHVRYVLWSMPTLLLTYTREPGLDYRKGALKSCIPRPKQRSSPNMLKCPIQTRQLNPTSITTSIVRIRCSHASSLLCYVLPFAAFCFGLSCLFFVLMFVSLLSS